MKLTTLEKRAKAACEQINADGHLEFAIGWTRSRDFGLCPSIYYKGEKAAYADGCGYDKESAVLAQFLQFLTRDENFLSGFSGAGTSALIRYLSENGYGLTVKDATKTASFCTIKKIKN